MSKFENKRVFIADRIHPAGTSLLKKKKFEIYHSYNLSNQELVNKLSKDNTEILIIRSVREIDRVIILRLKKETRLKLICTASSGVNNIDAGCARKSGISILNVPDGNYVSAAEHTFALILAVFKNLIWHNTLMKKGVFDYGRYVNFELSGKTIGIVGVGRVGGYVAKIARAFNMRILGNDIIKSLRYKYRWIEFTGLRKLLKFSDIVTIHIPLNKSTSNLIDKEEFRIMKPGAVLVNCARGGIINERALIKVLKNEKILYAGLDVFENEPNINKELTKLDNIILTPHVAGKTKECTERMSVELANSIIKYFD